MHDKFVIHLAHVKQKYGMEFIIQMHHIIMILMSFLAAYGKYLMISVVITFMSGCAVTMVTILLSHKYDTRVGCN